MRFGVQATDGPPSGGVHKRLKGSVLKTDSGALLQLEFESLNLRHDETLTVDANVLTVFFLSNKRFMDPFKIFTMEATEVLFMNEFQIFTDSSCDLTTEMRQSHNLEYFRMAFTVDGKFYDADLDYKDYSAE